MRNVLAARAASLQAIHLGRSAGRAGPAGGRISILAGLLT
jgi:hypothetical protein